MLLAAFIGLCLVCLAAVIWVRVVCREAWSDPKAEVQSVMQRLRRLNPTAYRIYRLSVIVPAIAFLFLVVRPQVSSNVSNCVACQAPATIRSGV